MRTIAFDSGLVYGVDDEAEVVRSVWPDGVDLTATPGDDAESRARARALGYDGERATWEMTVEHDLAHHLVARALGEPWSEHLRLIAKGRSSAAGDAEERLALLLQRVGREGILGVAD